MQQKNFNIVTRPNIKVIYKEVLTEDTTVSLAVLKKYLDLNSLSKGTSIAIFSVFVELMNNVRMHAARRKEPEAPLGFILLGEDTNTYYLQSTNAIKDDKVDSLRTQLNRMNKHIKTELRKYYKYRRRLDNPNPDSSGAGIGLIEIAKRTKEPMEFSFTHLGDNLSNFTIIVKFNKGGK